MAYATVKGSRHAVRVVQDLADNWSLEVYPERPKGAEKRDEPFKNWPVPIVMKLRADSRAHALVAGLDHMKKLGQIDDFHVDEDEKPAPPPPPPAKPAPAPAAAAAAAKPAAAPAAPKPAAPAAAAGAAPASTTAAATSAPATASAPAATTAPAATNAPATPPAKPDGAA